MSEIQPSELVSTSVKSISPRIQDWEFYWQKMKAWDFSKVTTFTRGRRIKTLLLVQVKLLFSQVHFNGLFWARCAFHVMWSLISTGLEWGKKKYISLASCQNISQSGIYLKNTSQGKIAWEYAFQILSLLKFLCQWIVDQLQVIVGPQKCAVGEHNKLESKGVWTRGMAQEQHWPLRKRIRTPKVMR